MYGAKKVEANALVTRPKAGRELMRDTLLRYIDMVAMGEWQEDCSNLREELESNVMELLDQKFGE